MLIPFFNLAMGRVIYIGLEEPQQRQYCCWKCNEIKTGEPAHVSHAINGDFEYCAHCWLWKSPK
jgi:hypothetical protein